MISVLGAEGSWLVMVYRVCLFVSFFLGHLGISWSMDLLGMGMGTWSYGKREGGRVGFHNMK